MKERLQQAYNHFIKCANFNYEQASLPIYAEFQEVLLSKSEAYESAAEYLARTFKGEIIETMTKRFNSIREHHMEESEHNEPMNLNSGE